jgi:hypothetical protein
MQLQHSAVPAARLNDLVMTESGDEVLVYDQTVQHIHHLNHVAATVWQLCDGQRGVGEIAAAATSGMSAEVSGDAVKLALRQLDDAKLLDGTLASELRGAQHSRRVFMRRAAMVGAAAVPAVISIAAPSAAAAQTGGPIGGICNIFTDPNCIFFDSDDSAP